MTASPDPVTWLILIYRLPAHSGLKAVIRRKTTALGVVYPANAVAALPASRERECGETITRCSEIIARIEIVMAAGHFGYHDLGKWTRN